MNKLISETLPDLIWDINKKQKEKKKWRAFWKTECDSDPLWIFPVDDAAAQRRSAAELCVIDFDNKLVVSWPYSHH